MGPTYVGLIGQLLGDRVVERLHLQLKCDETLGNLANIFDPVLRGSEDYYGRSHRSALRPLWWHVNDYLVRWLHRKDKRLGRASGWKNG